ncbi:carbohydrate kinase family protein [Actinoplanes friuliensis]|uniref:PfkB domain-containing protein n=1 Tax=Actinoplanes friuliensis DSM 7358 TaxID=1246995 RepID=U5WAY6_9ACTN|nr:carbohydrate kinase family protein [Actinoplanes friuliensis]AGZ45135.1 PfkB domain-containing protein [Actinoplanes friuliensis DSM 7358]
MTVLVVGGTGIDTVVPVGELPILAADGVQAAGPVRTFVSHTGTCVALGLRNLGVEVTVADAVGDDEEGRRITAAFAGWGIPLRTAISTGGTRRAVNLMDPHGRRLSIFDARVVPGYRLPVETYRPLLDRARHVHVTLTGWARHLLAEARTGGRTVSTDLHDWNGTDDYHRDFALGADLVFVSGVQLGDRAAEVARWILADGVASHVVVTAGAAGADLYTAGGHLHEPAADLYTAGGHLHEPAADPGGPIVDSNGAGDALAAAFLAALSDGLDDAACLRRGAIAGAYACTRPVGPDGFIRRQD